MVQNDTLTTYSALWGLWRMCRFRGELPRHYGLSPKYPRLKLTYLNILVPVGWHCWKTQIAKVNHWGEFQRSQAALVLGLLTHPDVKCCRLVLCSHHHAQSLGQFLPHAIMDWVLPIYEQKRSLLLSAASSRYFWHRKEQTWHQVSQILALPRNKWKRHGLRNFIFKWVVS